MSVRELFAWLIAGAEAAVIVSFAALGDDWRDFAWVMGAAAVVAAAIVLASIPIWIWFV